MRKTAAQRYEDLASDRDYYLGDLPSPLEWHRSTRLPQPGKQNAPGTAASNAAVFPLLAG